MHLLMQKSSFLDPTRQTHEVTPRDVEALQLTVASLPELASAGAYDNFPVPVSKDDWGSDMREGGYMI